MARIRSSLRSGARAAALALAAAAAVTAPASAALRVGAKAPAFTAQASLGGNVFAFDLAGALAKGPVVLYFYPAAFTSGCTLEAHDFASHAADFAKLGVTVIGVSGDGIAKLRKFSVSECRSTFAVAADQNHRISHEYDATLGFGPMTFSNRTSYVIARDGTVAYAYSSLDPAKHVANLLDAVAKLGAK